MAVYKEILASDIKSSRSALSQLIDVIQEDISGSSSRQQFQHWITGSSIVGPGVTSSLYQTIHDQDFSLQQSNAIFDMTIGLRPSGSVVLTSQAGIDAAGKELFPSSSLQMREKMDIYRQFAGALLGDNAATFTAPFDSSDSADEMDSALFIAFKRLFSRDQIKRETFAMRFFQTASSVTVGSGFGDTAPVAHSLGRTNLNRTSTSGSTIFTDIGSSVNKLTAFGGAVGNIVDASNTSRTVGLMFYDRGIAVFDLAKITSGSQFMSGTIDAVHPLGQITLGGAGTQTARSAKFIPDFVVSASIDNIVDHIAACRFGSGSNSAITFQNVTNINSTLVFCRLGADEFNYSSNPTFTDDDDRIRVIDVGSEDVQRTCVFFTGVGLYDAQDNLLAVAKTSRPIEKNDERDLTVRIRLDFASRRRYSGF